MDALPDNLVLFDGACNLCNSAVRFIIRHDNRASFKFTPIQSDRGTTICRGCGLDPEDILTFVLVRNGRCYFRSSAAIEVAVQLGGVWKLFAGFKLLPERWRDRVYAFVAENRYRWFGKGDSCLVPSQDINQRFLK